MSQRVEQEKERKINFKSTLLVLNGQLVKRSFIVTFAAHKSLKTQDNQFGVLILEQPLASVSNSKCATAVKEHVSLLSIA